MMISVCGVSVSGKGKTHNEDQIFCQGHFRKNGSQDDFYHGMLDTEESCIFAIFDGIGGLKYGEIASKECAEELNRIMLENKNRDSSVDSINSIIRINRRIAGRKEKIGSTAVIAQCCRNNLQIANIGDSRAYFQSGSKLILLTEDHTLEQQMKQIHKDYGIDYHEKEYQKHALTQYIGVPESEFIIEPYEKKLIVNKGEQCLLCSDGLSDVIDDHQLSSVLMQEISIKEKVNMLLDMALKPEKTDNISIIIIRWE